MDILALGQLGLICEEWYQQEKEGYEKGVSNRVCMIKLHINKKLKYETYLHCSGVLACFFFRYEPHDISNFSKIRYTFVTFLHLWYLEQVSQTYFKSVVFVNTYLLGYSVTSCLRIPFWFLLILQCQLVLFVTFFVLASDHFVLNVYSHFDNFF